MPKPFSLSGRLQSFRYAGRGLLLTLRTQHNARIHAAATIVVVGGGLILGLSRLEWCAVVLACAAVWSAEALNTALELLADATTQEMHPLIGQAKDVAAGAVLVTAIGAAVVGLLVFGPHLLVRTR
jgi:diacylglycerol kinase (ATP)